MANAKQPLVDDELYVNEATIEALGNEIESDVRRSLLRTVLLPLLSVGVVLLLLGVFWWIPQEVGKLLREDPFVKQRFREATAQYLSDPVGGGKVVREQITSVVRAEKGIQKIVDEAVGEVVSGLNVDELIQKQIDDVLIERPLAVRIKEFLEGEKGRELLTGATQGYFDSPAGKEKLSAITSNEVRSENFRTILVDELDRALDQDGAPQ